MILVFANLLDAWRANAAAKKAAANRAAFEGAVWSNNPQAASDLIEEAAAYRGWGGRDALMIAMHSRFENAAEWARLLAPFSDPSHEDWHGVSALEASLGSPDNARLMPLDGDGKERPWALAFDIVCPWASPTPKQAARCLAKACSLKWERAARDIVDFHGGALYEASSDELRKAIGMACLCVPELASCWAREGLLPKEAWEMTAKTWMKAGSVLSICEERMVGESMSDANKASEPKRL